MVGWLGSGTLGTQGNIVLNTGGSTDGTYPAWFNTNAKVSGALLVSGGATMSSGITTTAISMSGGLTTSSQITINHTGGSSPVSWSAQEIVMQGSPNVGIAFHVPAYFYAPYLRNYQGLYRIDCVDSGGGAYATLGAAGYYTDSTIEVKESVVRPNDDELLQRLFWTVAKKYDMKPRRKSIRPTTRFKDVNARWVAKGHSPLDPYPNHYTMEDHDCTIDECEGDADHPCRLLLEDKNRIGLIAEEVHELFPEITSCDFETGAPQGLFVEQMAALGVGGLAALIRTMTSVVMRVDALEAKVGS